jgi:hypothetical protein
MLTINEIIGDAKVSRKQINNRIQKVSHHENLVIGGGKGRGGKYHINPLLINFLTSNNYYRDIKYEGQLSNPYNGFNTFSLIDWRWFCCFSPKCFLEPEQLLEKVWMNDGDICYYSIHGRKRTNVLHIHYVVTSEGNLLNFKTTSNYIDQFDRKQDVKCFNYFNNPKDNQFVVDVGFLLGVKHHDRFDRIRLN